MSNASAESNLIYSETSFLQDGKVELSKDGQKTESGVLNGVDYKFYYTDGSGSFSGARGETLDSISGTWNVNCRKDAITDEKMCYMYFQDLWIFIDGKGRPTVSVGSNHYPSSTVAIRIDKAAPIVASSKNGGSFANGKSMKIIDSLKNAKSITTRYEKWPSEYPIDSSWEIYGFNEAYRYLNWAIKHIR